MTPQLKIGSWYRRRDGRTVGPAKQSNNPGLVGIGNYLYNPKWNGYFLCDTKPDRKDLISEAPKPGRKGKGNMTNVYIFICKQFQIGSSIHAYDNMTEARKDRKLMRGSEFVCGPITKIQIEGPR